MNKILIENLHKSFGGLEVLHNINLAIDEGELVVFVGPSGCGKSTLLRQISGLDQPTSGRIMIDGQDVTNVSAADRGLAMVFQSYALYPHMTVRQNLEFGLQNNRTPKDEVARRVNEAAQMLGIEQLLSRRPGQLSGGQRQRVAIGRAIVRDPTAFLLDEPLSNLDAELRGSMRAELAALHQRLGTTMIYVTHDQIEAMTLANRIVVLRDGRIEQIDTPINLFDRPANKFVAGFIGMPNMNFLSPADVQSILADDTPTQVDTIGVRPQHLQLANSGIPGTVTLIEALGTETVVHAKLPSGIEVLSTSPGHMADLQVGREVCFSAPHDSFHFFDAAGSRIEVQP